MTTTPETVEKCLEYVGASTGSGWFRHLCGRAVGHEGEHRMWETPPEVSVTYHGQPAPTPPVVDPTSVLSAIVEPHVLVACEFCHADRGTPCHGEHAGVENPHLLRQRDAVLVVIGARP